MSRWIMGSKKSSKFNPFKMIPFRFYDGEEGAANGVPADAGDSGAEVVNLNVPLPDFDMPIPEHVRKRFVENDPDLQNMLREDAKTNKEKSVDKGTEADLPEDDDETDLQDDSSTPVKDDTDSKGENADAKNSSTEPEEEDLEFADNVIEGLKGEHLKKLPREAQLALAEFHEKATEASEKLTTTEKRLNDLLSDPVVKTRSEMLEAGKEKYGDYGLTSKEKQSLAQRFMDTVGLDKDEAGRVISEIESGLNAVVDERVDSRFNNLVIQEDSRRKVDEVTTSARKAFLELGNLNPTLKFKESDPNAFYVRVKGENGKPQWALNDKHPEAKQYAEKIVPIASALAKSGMTYETVSNMVKEFGIESLYTMVAKKLNLPVAINTGDRDRKMVMSEHNKKMLRFLKDKSSGELSVEGKSSTAAKDRVNKAVMKEGFDIVKLSEGGKYLDDAYAQKPGNAKHAQRIAELADEGAAYQEKQFKRK